VIAPRRRVAAPRAASLAALLVGLGVLLSAASSRAQSSAASPRRPAAPWERGVTQKQKQTAWQLFSKAIAHHLDRQFDQALEEYRQALRLWPHPVIHYNLGLAQIGLDQLLDADEHLERALAYGPPGLNNDLVRFEHARQKRAELGRMIATVQVTCRIEGAKILVDREHVLTVERGKPPTVWKRIRVDKQPVHEFVAELPGGEVVLEWHAVEPGEPLRVELQERKEPRWPWLTWQPAAVMAVGVQLAVAGGTLEWSAYASYRKYKQEVGRCDRCRTSDYDHLLDRGNTRRALGIASLGVAGVALVAGGVAAYLNRPVPRRLRSGGRGGKPLSLAPLVGPGLGGAAVVGRF
jgi:tetratricopeptide (TPR) repeat protein